MPWKLLSRIRRIERVTVRVVMLEKASLKRVTFDQRCEFSEEKSCGSLKGENFRLV